MSQQSEMYRLGMLNALEREAQRKHQVNDRTGIREGNEIPWLRQKMRIDAKLKHDKELVMQDNIANGLITGQSLEGI